jgi:antitoxin component YwqK of YwqJK toxin-antitoxin module
MVPRKLLAVSLFVAAALVTAGCDRQGAEARKRITPEYDKTTGKLALLKYDSNGNGIVDTWSYMDGARVVRIEIDKDEDGKIDRWEYYDANQKLEKVGFSRLNDGKEDAWSYNGPDGSIARIDVSTRRDGKVTRIEHYRNNVLVAAEEDSDEDGKIDKWEVYDGERLASVAFDTTHRGTADRRLIYDANGATRLEVDQKGDGHFTAVGSANPEPRIPTNPKSRIPNPDRE